MLVCKFVERFYALNHDTIYGIFNRNNVVYKTYALTNADVSLMAKLFEQNGAQLNIVYECNRPRQTIDLISNNPKIIARTIEPEITEADLEYVHVLRLKDDPFVLPINLCYRKDTLLNPAKRAFLSLILAAYDK